MSYSYVSDNDSDSNADLSDVDFKLCAECCCTVDNTTGHCSNCTSDLCEEHLNRCDDCKNEYCQPCCDNVCSLCYKSVCEQCKSNNYQDCNTFGCHNDICSSCIEHCKYKILSKTSFDIVQCLRCSKQNQ
jgi:hypothetical protein